jgi:hypothetical protein
MSKLNQLQREQLKRIILDSVLQRLTTAEAQAHVKDKLGVEITIDYLNHVKMELRQDSQKELCHLRKNRLSYMNHLFFERIDEVKNMQRKLWEIITSNQEEKPEVVVRSISELHKLSQSLCQMYEMLPLLGQLPSNAFAGLVDDTSDSDSGGEDQEEIKQVSSPSSSISQPSYIGGNSSGMYNLRHDV